VAAQSGGNYIEKTVSWQKAVLLNRHSRTVTTNSSQRVFTDSNPIWDETMVVAGIGNNDAISMTLFDHPPEVSSPRVIGQSIVPLSQYPTMLQGAQVPLEAVPVGTYMCPLQDAQGKDTLSRHTKTNGQGEVFGSLSIASHVYAHCGWVLKQTTGTGRTNIAGSFRARFMILVDGVLSEYADATDLSQPKNILKCSEITIFMFGRDKSETGEETIQVGNDQQEWFIRVAKDDDRSVLRTWLRKIQYACPPGKYVNDHVPPPTPAIPATRGSSGSSGHTGGSGSGGAAMVARLMQYTTNSSTELPVLRKRDNLRFLRGLSVASRGLSVNSMNDQEDLEDLEEEKADVHVSVESEEARRAREEKTLKMQQRMRSRLKKRQKSETRLQRKINQSLELPPPRRNEPRQRQQQQEEEEVERSQTYDVRDIYANSISMDHRYRPEVTAHSATRPPNNNKTNNNDNIGIDVEAPTGVASRSYSPRSRGGDDTKRKSKSTEFVSADEGDYRSSDAQAKSRYVAAEE